MGGEQEGSKEVVAPLMTNYQKNKAELFTLNVGPGSAVFHQEGSCYRCYFL